MASQQEAARKAQAEAQHNQTVRDANTAYIKTLAPICEKPLQEITGVDLYRCYEIKNETFEIIGFDNIPIDITDAKSQLDQPNIPAFCERKLQGMTANEMLECLPSTSDGASDIQFP
jgi:hypothetical protein